ncbi:DUF935 domain-containing protein [Xanthobacter sp. 126]|uniref:DUF935 domain-containing protein n=1 Tax=Xanthobacter sp. 126 TaxID=1131814 RepID=UPI00045E601D|nr:DUF935 domain-containing protein [Xanthobacter sp. 126]
MVSRPQLLGPNGLPIDRSLLSQEVAAPTVMGVRATHHEAIASGLKPERLAHVLRQAQLGNARDYLTLAEEMEERYLHYASQVQTRRLAIESITPTVESPKGMDTRIVDAVHELLDDAGLLDSLGELTDGIAKGYAVVEPIWEYDRKLLRPVEFKPRDQRFFQFDRVTLRELRLARDGSLDGDPIEKPTFIVHMPRSKSGIPIRRGFARAACWAFMLQSFALKDWAAFAEIYGVPFRVGKYHPGASEKDKKALLRAVASIANDAAAIIPQGMEIEFVEAEGAKGEAVFGGLLEYLDKQVSKLVVGQTMTADDGSSMAQAEVHNKVRIDIMQADCRQLANTLNRDLIPWFVAFNFGPQDAYPRVTLPVPEPEDLKELTEGVARLLPYGLKVGQKQMREKLGLSEPEEDDELLTPQAPARPDAKAPSNPVQQPSPADPNKPGRAGLSADGGFSHPRGCACAGCRSFAALAAGGQGLDVEAELETLFAEEMADWEQVTDPMFAKLRAGLAKANSYDELIALLPEIAGQGGAEQLAERLARLTAIARGLGDVAD